MEADTEIQELEADEAASEGAPFVVVTDGFEGPLDLLLALAREQKVDLRQISILALVDQYVTFIHSTPDLRLDLAADYIVMAAWLALLKSRLLLPEAVKPEERRSAEDDAKELADQIRRLALIRKAVSGLSDRLRLGRDWMTAGALSQTGPKQIGAAPGTRLVDLLTAFVREARRNAPPRIPALEKLDLRTVDDALQRMSGLIGSLDGWRRLIDVLPRGGEFLRSKSEAATHFVAMLELARTGRIEFRQDGPFDPIWIRKADPEEAAA